MAIKPQRGPARKFSLTSGCRPSSITVPTVTLSTGNDLSTSLVRSGLPGDTSRVMLNLEVRGFDVIIDERLLCGEEPENGCVEAPFILDFMGAERYFITYRNYALGLLTAFSYHNRPGIQASHPLK